MIHEESGAKPKMGKKPVKKMDMGECLRMMRKEHPDMPSAERVKACKLKMS